MARTSAISVSVKHIEKIAQQKFGEKATAHFNPNAPTKEVRDRWISLNQQAKEQIRELKTKLDSLPCSRQLYETLIEKATFVIDVDGDHPSIQELQNARDAILRRKSLSEEIDRLTKEMRDRWLWGERFEIRRFDGIGYRVLCSGSSEEEILEKIQKHVG